MLTTTLVAIQTFFCISLPPTTPEFNTSLEFQPFKTEALGKGIKQSEIGEEDYRIKTIVIDPGHGGHDPGCLGSHNHEKNLALGIAKKAAAYIAAQFPDVRVIMTRETDVFIPLHERANIANQNNADLFISIHCNYMPGSRATHGTETYVMGLHTAEQNLEVAKRENSAILLEENYEQNYDFDPNSTEGHIMLSMFQNAYLEQSILLAERVEEKFATQAGRRSRGVKQAGFYVLKATTMPSILIEAGFLSNRDEENFLSTNEGQDVAANAILQAFAEYKSIVESGSINTTAIARSEPPPPAKQPQVVRVAEQNTNEYIPSTEDRVVRSEPKIIINESPRRNTETNASIQFCIQLAAAAKPVDASQNKWQDLRYQVEVIQEDNYYKYQARGFYDLDAALQAKTYLKSKGFPDAFVVAYKNGKKISLEDAKKELGIKY